MKSPSWSPRARSRAGVVVIALLCAGATLAGCSSAPPVVRQNAPAQPVTTTAPDGRGAVRPLPAPSGCTANVIDGSGMLNAMTSAAPGDKICLTGDISDTRLVIEKSGTQQRPITVAGNGRTLVKGITVEGDYVTIDGINAVHPVAPGISLLGNHITVTNSTSISPRGNDGDALRFWGTYITIAHNTMRDTKNIKAHADCMQTFETADQPASQHIVIDSNRCEDIANTCLIMEGPHSLSNDGNGVGSTGNVVFTNNYCQVLATQALQIDDVQNLTVTNNDITITSNDPTGNAEVHAFGLQNESTGAKISGNKLSSGIKFEVGMDDTSRPGYSGPHIGGDP